MAFGAADGSEAIPRAYSAEVLDAQDWILSKGRSVSSVTTGSVSLDRVLAASSYLSASTLASREAGQAAENHGAPNLRGERRPYGPTSLSTWDGRC